MGPSIHLSTLLYVKANIDGMVSPELHLVRVSGADLTHHLCSWERFPNMCLFSSTWEMARMDYMLFLVLFKLIRNEEEKRTFRALWESPEIFTPLFLISLNC